MSTVGRRLAALAARCSAWWWSDAVGSAAAMTSSHRPSAVPADRPAPLTTPALIVTFIFEFRASWTDLMRPLIYLRDGSLFTLPRGLKVILDQFGQGGEGQWEVVLAASVIATLPMLVIFFLGQRYFVAGIATTGRKG